MERTEATRLEGVQTTFKFDAQTLETIEQLKRHFGATSKAEVMRKALALLELARKAREQGGELAIVDENQTVHRILIG